MKFETDRGQTMTTLFTDLDSYSEWRNAIPHDKTVGFVPTMGALHQGHISLVESAKSKCDYVVLSIYVNSLQFNSAHDYQRYPRTLDSDFSLCSDAQVTVVIAPSQSDIFPESNVQIVSPPSTAVGFEGVDRPGHFAGVTTVVDRLFSVVKPTHAYFGIKDYQQVAVITQMAAQLHPQITICICETARDADGLAMSSRNRFLTGETRLIAGLLPQALQAAIDKWREGSTAPAVIISTALDVLKRESKIDVQYVSVVRKNTMDLVDIVGETDFIIAAVVIDGIRLIDNMQFTNA